MPATAAPAVHADTVQFVKLGYNGAGSLDFRVDVGNFETFEAAAHAAGDYNGFDPSNVAESFRELFGEAMCVEFGRESSVVMYVHLPYWTHQRIDEQRFGMGERYTPEQMREQAARVIAWARSVHADEIGVRDSNTSEWNHRGKIGERPDKIRVWWD